MKPLKKRFHSRIPSAAFLVTGMGILETALQLTRYLSHSDGHIEGVVQFGIGGAYPDKAIALLDLCLADQEMIGDFGVCSGQTIEPFVDVGTDTPFIFPLGGPFLEKGKSFLREAGKQAHVGSFITVNCASGTRKRGEMVQRSGMGICENMEGAAAARICAEFNIPFLEIRSVSNLVVDRHKEDWRVAEAIDVCCDAVYCIASRFSRQNG